MIPKKIYVPKNSIKCLCHYDNSALALVTNSQKTGSVEYTDLSQVWHPAEEEPRPYKDILTEKKKGFYVVCSWCNEGYGWKSYVKIFQLKRWAYIDDLLPKGGEK